MTNTALQSAAAILLMVVVFGCGAAPTGSVMGPWQAEFTTVGDTTVVRTLSGSDWEVVVDLVEELRIGQVEGAEYEMFGVIGGLAVAPSGEILVYESQANEVRRYSEDGSYVGLLGGPGAGPGEYQNVAGIGIWDDGQIVLSDFGNRRFNVYEPDASFATSWPIRPAIAEARPLHTTVEHGLFLHDLHLLGDGASWSEVLVRLDKNGVPIDTLVVPFADYRPPAIEVKTERSSVGMALPFSPIPAWSITSAGNLVAMHGNRYAIDILRTDGSILRIERTVAFVPVTASERAAEEVRITAFFRRFVDGWTWDGPAMPVNKPPVKWVHTGSDGTIWVQVAQVGSPVAQAGSGSKGANVVREPVVFDVFESDGRFLGEVRAPEGFQTQPYPIFQRDAIVAVVEDENEVSFVARFRIGSPDS